MRDGYGFEVFKSCVDRFLATVQTLTMEAIVEESRFFVMAHKLADPCMSKTKSCADIPRKRWRRRKNAWVNALVVRCRNCDSTDTDTPLTGPVIVGISALSW